MKCYNSLRLNPFAGQCWPVSPGPKAEQDPRRTQRESVVCPGPALGRALYHGAFVLERSTTTLRYSLVPSSLRFHLVTSATIDGPAAAPTFARPSTHHSALFQPSHPPCPWGRHARLRASARSPPRLRARPARCTHLLASPNHRGGTGRCWSVYPDPKAGLRPF